MVFRAQPRVLWLSLQTSLPVPIFKRLQRLVQQRLGLDLDDPRALAQSGVDGQRDLVFSIGAERLERVHEAARQPAALLRALRVFGQGKGPAPLPLTWFDLVLPARDHARLERTVTTVLRKVSGKPSLSFKHVTGQLNGKPGRFALWSEGLGGYVLASWRAKDRLHLRLMTDMAMVVPTRAVPRLSGRSAKTRAQMERCRFFASKLAIYIDAQAFARFGQLISLTQSLSGTAAVDPELKLKLLTQGAAESMAFEKLHRAGEGLFPFYCETVAGGRWGLTPGALAALQGGAEPRQQAQLRLSALDKLIKASSAQLERWLKNGGPTALQYAGLFLWPAVLAHELSPLSEHLKPRLLGKAGELDQEAAILAVPTFLTGILWAQ